VEFLFSEDQQLFRESVRDFLAKECTPEVVRSVWESETGRNSSLWKQLAELGLLGALAPEEHGGMGMDEIDFVLLLEECGRAALSEPLAETAAIGVPLLTDLGGDLAAEWLPRAASGDATLSVGLEVDPLVAAADSADLFLLQSGDEIHALPRDSVSPVAQPANDRSRRLFSVEWTPSTATCVVRGAEAKRLLALTFDRGVLAYAAQQLGIAKQLLDLAVAYAKEREQFGKPIGSFQAIKHLIANVAVALEFARPVVYRAAYSVARGTKHRASDISHAKLAASEAALRAAKTSLQVHGAIGYTWEVNLHLWMKRAWSLDVAWGTAAFHRARVAECVPAAGAPIGPGGLDL